jgi:hypothetical protein
MGPLGLGNHPNRLVAVVVIGWGGVEVEIGYAVVEIVCLL